MKKGVLGLLGVLTGATAGGCIVESVENKKLKKEIEINRKNDALLRLFVQWMFIKQEGRSLEEYFLAYEYKKIAIYGVHYVGECLIKELENSEIEICYALDKNAPNIKVDTQVEIMLPNNVLEKVDAIVVTPFFYFNEIKCELEKRVDFPIISIEDIIYEI